MKKIAKRYALTTIIIFLIFLMGGATQAWAQSDYPTTLEDGTILLESFEHDSPGDLPRNWYDRDGNDKLINYNKEFLENFKYKVVNSGNNNFLRYEGTQAKHINLPLINENKENIYNINIYETPILSWKVRAHNLPEGGNEKVEQRNDTVASIYVVFDMGRIAFVKKVPKTIRYTWSSELKEGETDSKLFGNQRLIVTKSGDEETGTWITFERNIVEDYRRTFGDDPPKTPMAILILSDGDSTGSFVKADYDDIMLKPEK